MVLAIVGLGNALLLGILVLVFVFMLFPMFLIGLIVLAIEFGGLKFTNELGR